MEQTILFVINTLVLLYVLIYGLALAISNFTKRMRTLFNKSVYTQSPMGRFLDMAWLVGFFYLFSIGREFNNLFLETFFTKLF